MFQLLIARRYDGKPEGGGRKGRRGWGGGGLRGGGGGYIVLSYFSDLFLCAMVCTFGTRLSTDR